MKKLVVLIFVLLLSSLTPLTALAAEISNSSAPWDGNPITVYATIAAAGEFVKDSDGNPVISEEIEVTDLDEDKALTLNDAFIAIHASLCPDGTEAYVSYEGQYGLSISKLWGNESGAFGYYINNISAISAADPITSGDSIVAFVYADTINYSDMFTWFEQSEIKVPSGEEFTLTLNGYTYDEAWNMVKTSCADAKITVIANGAELLGTNGTNYVTNEDGQVKLSLSEPGNYAVIASSGEGGYIVPASCSVTVESSTDIENNSDNSNEESSDTVPSDSLPAQGENNSQIYILIIAGIAVCAVIIFTVVRKKGTK